MSAEFDATELYKKIAQATDNEMAKKVMQSIADEESIHAGEFRKLIMSLDPNELKLEDKGEKEAQDVMGAAKESKVNEESLLKVGDKVTYQGKQQIVKAIDLEDMLITLDNDVTVTPQEIEDFMPENKTSSDDCGQPANGKAAQEVMNKSAKKSKVKVGEGYNDVACNDCGYVGHLNSFSRGFRDRTTCPVCKSIQLGFDADRKKQAPKPEMKEDVQVQFDIDPKVEQFLTDNWASFIDDEDKANNLVKLFKITTAKAKEYVDKVANGKATMNAVHVMAEASWKQKAEALQETVNQLNGVIEVLNETIANSKSTTSVLQERTQLKESMITKLQSQLDASLKENKKLQQTGQLLVKEHANHIKEIKSQQNKDLIKFYVDARIKAIRLNLSPKALTILESCGSKEEVDSEIHRLQDQIREAALQSNVPSTIAVTKTVSVNPKQQDIDNKIAKVFQSFGV
jgi:rubrerythrin